MLHADNSDEVRKAKTKITLLKIHGKGMVGEYNEILWWHSYWKRKRRKPGRF